ncbi:MAG: hypothetical protein HY898_22320 [Deltaproteobacteria bacterium]|nr:hypothetical protein [Deltaproteobacteria bacterium]
MNGAQRRMELQRLEQAWRDNAAACGNAIEEMRRLLPANQTVAVDTAHIEEVFDGATPTVDQGITLPSFAMRV